MRRMKDDADGDKDDDDGIVSRTKLQAAAADLAPWIPSSSLSSSLRLRSSCQKRSDCYHDHKESLAYRCRCSFQIVGLVSSNGSPSYHYAVRHAKEPHILPQPYFAIANRRIQQAMHQLWLILNYNNDDIINNNNNKNMEDMKEQSSSTATTTALATTTTTTTLDSNAESKAIQQNAFRHNLTSVTFSTSWNEQDCVLTMNYHPCIVDHLQWQMHARHAIWVLNLLQLTGRARKTLLRACSGSSVDNENRDSANAAEPVVLFDTLILKHHSYNNNKDNDSDDNIHSHSSWTVDLLKNDHPAATSAESADYHHHEHDNGDCEVNNDGDGSDKHPTTRTNSTSSITCCTTTTTTTTSSIQVHYRKPEGAFFHPNPKVMCQALEWILNRLQQIRDTLEAIYGDDDDDMTNKNNKNPLLLREEQQQQQQRSKKLCLLELYCGCGAHTMALAKSKLLPNILAVELDERLVEALKRNCELNHIPFVQQQQQQQHPVSSSSFKSSSSSSTTSISKAYNGSNPEGDNTDSCCKIEIVAADAGKWVRRQQERQCFCCFRCRRGRDCCECRQQVDDAKDDASQLVVGKSSCSVLPSPLSSSEEVEVVVLVDPPKQGLEKQVCQFLLGEHDDDDGDDDDEFNTHCNQSRDGGSCCCCGGGGSSGLVVSHVLYISCGREALQRDLNLLDGGFEVVDCMLLDLFPGTSAVETLVHLRRRSRTKKR